MGLIIEFGGRTLNLAYVGPWNLALQKRKKQSLNFFSLSHTTFPEPQCGFTTEHLSLRYLTLDPIPNKATQHSTHTKMNVIFPTQAFWECCRPSKLFCLPCEHTLQNTASLKPGLNSEGTHTTKSGDLGMEWDARTNVSDAKKF